MVLRISFAVDGDKVAQLQRDFQLLGKAVKKPFALGVGKKIADNFLRIERAQFASEGARGGKKWAPLKKRTLKNRPPGLPLLRGTGRLEAALTSRSGAHKEVLRGDFIELGVKTSAFPSPYPLYHQTGTFGLFGIRTQSEATKGMPRRPIVELTKKDKLRWTKIISRGLFAQQTLLTGGPL